MPIFPGNGFFLAITEDRSERVYVYVRRVQTRSGKPVFQQWTRKGVLWTWIGVSVPTHRMVYLIARYPTITNGCSCSSKEVENEILETVLRTKRCSILSGVCTKIALIEMFWNISRRTAYSTMMDLYEWKRLVTNIRHLVFTVGFFSISSPRRDNIVSQSEIAAIECWFLGH